MSWLWSWFCYFKIVFYAIKSRWYFFLMWHCISFFFFKACVNKKQYLPLKLLYSLYYLKYFRHELQLCPLLQAYAPGPYGDYTAPPPHASQVVYSPNGQPYAVAYPYQYQGNQWKTYPWLEMFHFQPFDKKCWKNHSSDEQILFFRIRCPWSESCRYSRPPTWKWWRCSSGDAGWSCDWFGSRISLLCLLVSRSLLLQLFSSCYDVSWRKMHHAGHFK